MKNVGTLLLGVWLVATGLKSVIRLNFDYDWLVLGILALVSGVLLILKR
jgi:hypothetical protein